MFQVATLSHPGKARVRRLGSVGAGQLAMSVQGNNEVGVWSVESSSRQISLTAPAPQHSVTAFSFLSPDRVITGGTDCKLRYWTLSSPLESTTLGQTEGGVVSVGSKLVEGSQVYTELATPRGGRAGRAEGESGGAGGAGTRLVADIQHTDGVTDLCLVNTQRHQTLLVTASNDGVIKLWK